jgi:hypothetical protein
MANQQGLGQDPFQPLNESVVSFDLPRVTMVSGASFETNVSWSDTNKSKCFYNAWLQAHGQRVKLATTMLNKNKTLHLDYVPSIFGNATEMNLTFESLIEKCGFSASVPIDYRHNLSEVKHDITFRNAGKEYPWASNDTQLVNLTDWLDPTTKFDIVWHQSLGELIDDGYSCSACISRLTETREVITRTFERNLGQAEFGVWTNGDVPSNRLYRLEISPSSAKREGFAPLYVYLEMVPVSGPDVSYKVPFTTARNAGMLVVLILNFLFIGFRLYGLVRKKGAADKGEEKVPFKSGAPRERQNPLQEPLIDEV